MLSHEMETWGGARQPGAPWTTPGLLSGTASILQDVLNLQCRRFLLVSLLGLFLSGGTTVFAAAAAGSVLWRQNAGTGVWGSPAEAPDGTIVVGSQNGRLYAFDGSGASLWLVRLGDDIYGSPAISPDGTIYVGVDKDLVAVRPGGTVRWRVAAQGGVRSRPALDADGSVLFTSLDNSLYSIQPNGRLRWRFETFDDSLSSPAVGADGTIYFGSRDNRLYAVNREGRSRWAFFTDGNVDSSPAIGSDGLILAGSADKKLVAMNPNGTRRWEFSTPHAVLSSPAVAPNGDIYFGTTGGEFYALSSDGELLWDIITTNRAAFSSPAVTADGTVYTTDQDGIVYAFSSTGGRPWTYHDTNSMKGGALTLLRNGNLVVGTDNGSLMALKGNSGPAQSSWPMFGRDPAHTASGTVLRLMSATYSPGLIQLVSLTTAPPSTVTGYLVEDQPPDGWTVGLISHGGQYDARTKRVKFGPFADSQPRQLQYELTPPLRESGTRFFGGNASVGGWTSPPLGRYSQNLLPLHPADVSPTDGTISLREATSYVMAWQQGATWPADPQIIPGSYADRAVALWRQGEDYQYDPRMPTAPGWWLSSTHGVQPMRLEPAEEDPSPSLSTLGNAEAQMANRYQSGVAIDVALEVRPQPGISVYALEDHPPEGWIVSRISANGVWDPWHKKVKWGPFNDGLNRRLTYQAMPPATATNNAHFSGTVAFNGTNTLIIGQRDLQPGVPTDPWVIRQFSSEFAPLWRQTVTLQATPPSSISYYVIEDQPPIGWTVIVTTPGAIYDSVHHVVRFGPFQGDSPQSLTYDIIPPAQAGGVASFAGRYLVDDLENRIGGTDQTTETPLHPADFSPVNSVLSLNEMTAYAAAWKSGSNWGQPSIPVEASSVATVVGLWKQAEGYHYSTNAPAETYPWAPDLSRMQPGLASLNTNFPPATDSSAVALMPTNYLAGQSVSVQLKITAASNVLVYAVEDLPPLGWPVDAIDQGGWQDPVTGKIKWGPFFDQANRLLSYRVTPPTNIVSPGLFVGVAAFDRRGTVISGARQLNLVIPAQLEVLQYSVDSGLDLQLTGGEGEIYEIQKSTGLSNWSVWLVITNSPNPSLVQDPGATNASHGFYRALSR